MKIYPELDNYLKRAALKSPEFLVKEERRAAREDFPIIGPLCGQYLFQLARMIEARRIFELGSGFGYSACWFSLALGKEAEIHLTDRDPENKTKALKLFSTAKLKSVFVYHLGDALGELNKARGKFDIILNDLDKIKYPDVIEPAWKKLRKGGVLVTDNVLWSGKVYSGVNDSPTRAIRKFTKMIYSHPGFRSTIIPIRDGLMVSLRV